MSQLLFAVCLMVIADLVIGGDVQILTAASNFFAQQLYQKIATNDSSICFSPLSVHSALTMTYLGASGDTAVEMSQVLGLADLPGYRTHAAYSNLTNEFNSVTDVTISIANGLFLNPRFIIKQQYKTDTQTYYDSEVANIEINSPEPERPINDFVEDKTVGKIKNIIPPGILNAQTLCVLVNSIYFNGTWEKEFRTSSTQKRNFYRPDGTTTQVDMMYDERTIGIKKNVTGGVDVAEIEFSGGRFALFVALPQTIDGIVELENSLTTPGRIEELLEGNSPTFVRLSLPKLTIESSFQLKTPLTQLGMVKALSPSQANFQGISDAGGVYIDEVFHKTYMEIMETGTVAAAATAVLISKTSLVLPPEEEFTVDHPCLIFLRDKETKDILFQAKIFP